MFRFLFGQAPDSAADASPPPQQQQQQQPPPQQPETLEDRLRRLRLQNQAWEEELRKARTAAVRARPIPPLQKDPVDCFEWGPCDNPEVFAGLARSRDLLPCILRRLNYPPFDLQVMDGAQLGVDGLALASVISAMRFPVVHMARQQVIAECLAPSMPDDKVMDEVQARVELERLFNDIKSFSNEGWFIVTVRGMRDQYVDGVLGGVWNVAKRAWLGNPTTEQKLMFFLTLIQHPDCNERKRAMYHVFITLVAIATRGRLGWAREARLLKEMTPVMPIIAEMYRTEDVQLTYQNFGHFLHDGNANAVMHRLLNQIPAAPMQLHVIVTQSAGSGITSLDIIAHAVHNHPHFPWYLVRRRYPTEWSNATVAMRQVDGKLLYRYRWDLGALNASFYRNVMWVCGKLLIRAGNKALEGYKRITEYPGNKQREEALITAYLKGDEADVDAERSPEEVDACDALVREAARYPLNVGSVAPVDGHTGPRMNAQGEDGPAAGLGANGAAAAP